MTFEEAVGNVTEAVVGSGKRLAHGVFRAGVIEARQQDERAIAHVAVSLLRDRLHERRHRLRACRASNGTRGVRPRRVIEIAQLRDRRLQLRRRHRLRRWRLLRARTARETEDTKGTKDTKGQKTAGSPLCPP